MFWNMTGRQKETGTLDPAWTGDRTIILEDTPKDAEELKRAVDISDPGSVAAYFVYAVTFLAADQDAGMEMMKYLFADIEPFGKGFTEGGKSGRAGWDPYFNERLRSDEYRWLPRAYFAGAEAGNGFNPPLPLKVQLHYNEQNTSAANAQSAQQLGRINIVYWVTSNAAGNKVNITLSRFEGSDRWYVTSGASSSALYYDQRSALTPEVKEKLYR